MIPDQEKNAIWAELEQKSPDLLKVFLSLKNEDELKAFFRDLMSERDLREFAMRWEVAKKLDAGVPFSQIQEESGESPVTITKINRWLKEALVGEVTIAHNLALDTSHLCAIIRLLSTRNTTRKPK
jgi:TrpR-related protein YerC/YecD